MKRKYITAIGIVLVLAASFALLLHGHKNPTPAHPPAVELGSATATVGLDNTDQLSKILLPEEFATVKKTLSNYIHTTYGESVVSANITSGSTKVSQNGSISFGVNVAKPQATFSVLLQRPNDAEIIFSIPGTSQPPVSLFSFSNPQ